MIKKKKKKTFTAKICWKSVHWGARDMTHEYIISSTEISVNWPGPNSVMNQASLQWG